MKVEYRKLSMGNPDAVSVQVDKDRSINILAIRMGEGLEVGGRITSFREEFPDAVSIPYIPRDLGNAEIGMYQVDIERFVALCYGFGLNPLPTLRKL
jgi:hypothetical protein